MEMTLYDDGDNRNVKNCLKRPATLDLQSPDNPSKKQNFSAILTSPDLNMLKLASPELERFIIANGNLALTPTPTQFLFSKNVTEEQEQYARGFIDALNQLHQVSAGGGYLKRIPTPVNPSPTDITKLYSSGVLPFYVQHPPSTAATSVIKKSPATAKPVESDHPKELRFNHNEQTTRVRLTEEAKPSFVRLTEEAKPSFVRLTEEAKPSLVRLTEEAKPSLVRLTDDARPLSLTRLTDDAKPSFSRLTEDARPSSRIVTVLDMDRPASAPMAVVDVDRPSNRSGGILTITESGHLITMRPPSTDPPLYRPPSATDSSCSYSSGMLTFKEEPQTVPSDCSSPPLSPLQSARIDMVDQERIKLERKRQRNRVAASKCRRRKLEKISELEDKVAELKGDNRRLEATADRLREQVCALKQRVMDHVKRGCQIMVAHEA